MLPTFKDINVYDSLDEGSAAQHFLGKDLRQAESLFRENFLCYQEDLMWMGPRAFCYYVEAAIAYLLTLDTSDGWDEVSMFCTVVEFQLEDNAESIAPARRPIHDALKAILERLACHKCDQQWFGDVPEQCKRLMARLAM